MSRALRRQILEMGLAGGLMVSLRHLLDINAVLGYRIDPELPAPEVLEGPGWKVHWCPRGYDKRVLDVSAPSGPGSTNRSEPKATREEALCSSS